MLIHERCIDVKTYERGEERLFLEGTLTDERLCKSFLYSNMQFVDPGDVHRIIVRMVIALPDLIIEQVEAEMPAIPVEMCKEVQEKVRRLAGLRLTRGFQRSVKDLLGGRNGCLHMNQLILSMSAAAVQGSYAYYNRVREDGGIKTPEFDSSIIVNSCHVWREGGPFASKLEDLKAIAGRARTQDHKR